MAKIISSNKGQSILVLNGFCYSEHSKSKDLSKIYWRCVLRDKCNARTHTRNNLENLEILKDGTASHINHVEDHRGITARTVVQGVKGKAEDQPNAPPQQILRRAVGDIDDPEVLAKLPERNSLRRLINLHQKRGRPRNPRSLVDIVLVPPYTTTKRGTRFLLYDSGEYDENRLIVFCSEESLKVLCDSRDIFADGTFKTVPNQFGQLYSIHGVLVDTTGKKNVFPLVFALCVRKDEETYRRLWEVVTEEAHRLNLQFRVTLFMTDFEIAAMNVQRRMFPLAQHKGCLFHMNQSLWRQVVNSGLRALYVNEENEPHTVRRDIQRLMAIPFVPIADVAEVFDAIVESVDDRVLDFCSYVENTYIRGHRALRRCRAVPPRFPPPEMWNVYQQAVDNSHRTNNVVEGYHSKFQKTLIVHHAAVWRFLDEIIAEENDFHVLKAQIRAGHINVKQPVNKRYQTSQTRIHRLALSYEAYRERDDIMTYLESISYHIKIQPD